MVDPKYPMPQSHMIAGIGKAAIVQARPTAAPHMNAGNWGAIVAGWKAQHRLVAARLADELACSRTGLAEGESLRQLVASEFGANLDSSPQKAIGYISLARTPTTAKPSLPAGTLPAGTRFRKVADPTASPPRRSATYELVEPVYWGATTAMQQRPEYSDSTSPNVKIRAIEPGTASNMQPGEVLVFADATFDPTILVQSAEAAGGSDGLSVAKLRALALALSIGQYGATTDAIVAGCLSTLGASRVAVNNDEANRWVHAWVADDSWCTSAALQDAVYSELLENWLGFGCRCSVRGVVNTPIAVSATVTLREQKYLADTTELSNRIRASLRSYFDERPDFWTWTNSGIGGAVCKADRRILLATSMQATYSDAGSDTQTPPAAKLPAGTNQFIRHFEISDTALELRFVGPGAQRVS